MTTRQFGLFIFGDEILSGKRQDRHFEKVKEILAARGLALSWVFYLGDDRARCVRALRESFASDDIVFSCGGIGSTPDDHTRQASAEALGLPLVLHPEAERLIRQRAADTGQPATEDRLRMGEFPQGAAIIPNPYNKIAGFSIREHYFVPGFPVMAWPMIEWVLETHYKSLFRAVAEFDRSMIVLDLFEATVTPLMQSITDKYPQFRVYSLPSAGEAGVPRHVELGLKALGQVGSSDPPAGFDQAYSEFRQGVVALGGNISEERQAMR
ncbi:MAG: competence/damage-inducible protein A [Burkholderiaceae bacterium]|nr:competence/damage-inducible protein A [Burkholderiaceae bacterium]